MRDWFTRLIFGPEAPPPPARLAPTRIETDPQRIVLFVDSAEAAEMSWTHLSMVSLVTPGRARDEFTWLLQDRDRRRVIEVPLSTPGEADLVRTMQARLPGFDNMAVVEALSATAAASAFIVWDCEWDDD